MFKKFLFLVFFLVSSLANEKKEEVKKILNVESPRHFMIMLDKAFREDNLAFIEERLDLRHIPRKKRKNYAKEIATRLKFIFDRKYILDIESLSNNTLGNNNDGEPFYREKVYEFVNDKMKLSFYIDRVKSGFSKGSWLISPVTIQSLDNFYNNIEGSYLYKYLPPLFFEYRIFNLRVFQIFLIFLYFLASLILSRLTSRLITYLTFKKFKISTNKNYTKVIRNKLPKIFNVFFLFIFFALFMTNHEMSTIYIEGYKRFIRSLLILSVYSPILLIIDLSHELIVFKNKDSKKKNQSQAAYPFGKGAFKIIISLVFTLVLLQNFGVDLSAIFAGLGIGGIAIALAGQKAIENLIGGLSLIFDRPIKIGDYCKFGDQTGTIEEIGLRSTKIRTLDRTVITIPNAEFAQTKIENYKKRDRIRLHKVIGITYDSSPDQIRYILLEIKKLLISHPKIDDEPCRIRFIDFNSFSLDIEIYAYVLTEEFSDFLSIKEDVFLQIMKIIKSSGTEFAFPSQTIYLKKLLESEGITKKNVEEKIEELRKMNELYFPEYPSHVKEKISNTIGYPNLD